MEVEVPIPYEEVEPVVTRNIPTLDEVAIRIVDASDGTAREWVFAENLHDLGKLVYAVPVSEPRTVSSTPCQTVVREVDRAF